MTNPESPNDEDKLKKMAQEITDAFGIDQASAEAALRIRQERRLAQQARGRRPLINRRRK